MAGACTSAAGPLDPRPVASTPSIAAASPTAPDGRTVAAAGGSLRFGLGDDPRSIDPRFADDEGGLLVVDALFDSLTTHGRNFFPVPSAASSWDVDEDQRRWTFLLRPEARFHDGTRVTAEDFVRSFRRIADGTARPRSFLAPLLSSIAGWEAAQERGEPLAGVVAVDDLTLAITLSRPEADLPSILAHPALAPVPVAADSPGWGESPVGNGPFRMVESWAHNQFIRVASASGQPGLDEILFRIYADDPEHRQQYLDFTAGQLHVAIVPPADFSAAVARYGSAGNGEGRTGVLDGPWASTYAYGFNVTRPPFDDPSLRQAVSLVIDREAIATEVALGLRDPADSLLPPGLVGHQPSTCQWCAHDPEAARALLVGREADLAGDPLVLMHPTGTTDTEVARRVAAAIRAELGLEVEVRAQSLQTFSQSLAAGEADLFRLGWTSEQPLPSSFLGPLFHSREVGRANLMGFEDSEVDRILDTAASTLDRRNRIELLQEAEARLATLAVIAPIMTYRLQRIVASDVEGLRMDSLGRVDLTAISMVPAT